MLPVVALLATGCSHNDDKAAASGPSHNVFLTSPVAAGGEGTVTLPAVVEESRSVSVGFKTAGQIERLYVKEGDRVRAGQLLAILDTTDYALGVRQLRLQYATAKSENERQAKLHASRNMSDNDFEKASSGLRQLALQLALQENKLSYCRLLAPSDGVVTRRNLEASEMVDAGTAVFELMDDGAMQVIVDLPARLYTIRDSFTSFTGESSLYPGVRFPLSMVSVTPRADNHQLYRLKLAAKAGALPELTAGMGVTVSVTSSASNMADGMEIPTSAIRSADGKTSVWVFNPADSTVSSRDIVIKSTGEGSRAIVTGDFTPSDRIVRAGVHHLHEGEKVRPLDSASGASHENIL